MRDVIELLHRRGLREVLGDIIGALCVMVSPLLFLFIFWGFMP